MFGRRKRLERRERERSRHLAALEVYRRAKQQEQVLEELQRTNQALWDEFRSKNRFKEHEREAVQELHDQAHEDITPPWEE